MIYRLLATCLLAVCCGACTASPDLNTPREIIVDEGALASGAAVSLSWNGEEQAMQLVENLFRCVVRTGGTVPMVDLRMELQNIAPASFALNSLYLRATDLPADGRWYSLSGNPTNPLLPHAAKLIVYRAGRLIPVVPAATTGTTDNLLISLQPVAGTRRLSGVVSCSARVPDETDAVDLVAQITIDY